MIKILHIIIDDKFINGAISLFETDARVENAYAIYNYNKNFKYVNKENIIHIDKKNALSIINQYNAVILHSLPCLPLNIIHRIDKRIKVIWFAWGYDLYENTFNLIPLKIYGEETKKQMGRSYKCKIHYIKQWIFCKLLLKKVLSRIDYFSGVFPYEYNLLKQNQSSFNAIPLDWYYGSTNFFIPEQIELSINRNKENIIIGNSANPTNNHLDVLKTLKNAHINKEAKIIIPLSYGYTDKYIRKVEQTAEKVAPSRIISLRTFLPLKEYTELISTCKVAIFAHERQQASDNIFLQLINGARVYMSENSAAYKYLKSIGLKIYSLQNELSLFNCDMLESDIINNRKILSNLYSSSKLIKRTYDINTILIDSIH